MEFWTPPPLTTYGTHYILGTSRQPTKLIFVVQPYTNPTKTYMKFCAHDLEIQGRKQVLRVPRNKNIKKSGVDTIVN